MNGTPLPSVQHLNRRVLFGYMYEQLEHGLKNYTSSLKRKKEATMLKRKEIWYA